MVLEVILVVLGVVLVVLGVVLVVLGGSRLSFLMKRFLIKGAEVYRASRTGPGPPGAPPGRPGAAPGPLLGGF